MAETKVRFGILGVANINNRIIPSFPGARHAVLQGIASRNLGRAQAAAAAANVPQAFGSYEDLLASPDIDAVYVPLPNTLHGEWVRRAADAGKHVLCEKPLAPTGPTAQELVDYCQARGAVLMDGFMWPHHPRTAKIREAIDQGAIGTVQRVNGAFTFPLPLDPDNIRLRPEFAGGSLLDVGCYPVYGIRWAFGEEPLTVFARARYDYEVDLEMSGMLTFAGGRMATFDCGFTMPMRQWLEITGTEGVIRVEDAWVPDTQARFTVFREGQEPAVVSVSGHDQIACMLDDFSTAVIEKKPVKPSPEEAVKTLRVLDALAKAAAEEREIDV